MPTGLDGNPEPIITPDRDGVLAHVARVVGGCPPRRVLVGVDGRAGSGKSTFGDELAGRLRALGHTVVRSTVDSFHRPRAERMRQGSTSAIGYYEDSHQLDVVVDELLRPFAAGAPQVRTAAFDESSDRPLTVTADVPADAVLVFDGLFIHRPELHRYWDVTIHLEADRRLDAGWLGFLLDDLPGPPSARAEELDRRLHRALWPRYRDGWASYVDTVKPASLATLVIDNDDLARPVLLRG